MQIILLAKVRVGTGNIVMVAAGALIVRGDHDLFPFQFEFTRVLALLCQVTDCQHREVEFRAGADKEAPNFFRFLAPCELQLHPDTLII